MLRGTGFGHSEADAGLTRWLCEEVEVVRKVRNSEQYELTEVVTVRKSFPLRCSTTPECIRMASVQGSIVPSSAVEDRLEPCQDTERLEPTI
jgi:hypothetical protein